MLTDCIADYLFVTEKSGMENLSNEGVPAKKIHFVGNVMIDSLMHYLPKTKSSKVMEEYNLSPSEFILVTMHRPSNVDSEEFSKDLYKLFISLAKKRKIIFPVHPRTRKNFMSFGFQTEDKNIILTDPIGYIDFLALTKNAELIITDSGGIQEESTYLGVQCITVRENTERPVTVELGTNHLVGTDLQEVERVALDILNGNKKKGKIPELWDGKAAERIAKTLVEAG
jgi:UDP-N-acetylglucosamine 2-epimerase (non-hydrolysing)